MNEDVQDEAQQRLFSKEELAVTYDLPLEPLTDMGSNPVWTDNKARFIMLYLRYFVYITHHGTYIDGFAGPQAECETDSWAAKLVLESKPRWIRHVHLCDVNRSQVKRLKELKAAQPDVDDSGKPINRNIDIYHGDFNSTIDEILESGEISESEATFCLLDQRTFECDWQTVEKLARYKKSGNKIELFYFLANGWLEHALAGQKDMDKLARWWGRDDWTQLRAMNREGRRDAIVDRLKADFGYQSVKAYPIFKRGSDGAIMYFMIHATDHPEGPIQMARAYRNTVRRVDPPEDTQIDLDLFPEAKAPESQPAEPITQLSA
jgi:three-Cys-motif partner protein